MSIEKVDELCKDCGEFPVVVWPDKMCRLCAKKSAEEILGPAEKCVVCGEDSDTQCENCEAPLCLEDADLLKYSDVDVCKDEKACEIRFDREAGQPSVN
jgi:hypothetical protein